MFVLEADLIEYFKQFGIVADAIVMRDRQTGRGRGFGFVKMQFNDKEKAQENKGKLLSINGNPRGHFINDKKVAVKSADDYVKPQPGQAPVQNYNQPQQMQMPGQQHNIQMALKTFQNLN